MKRNSRLNLWVALILTLPALAVGNAMAGGEIVTISDPDSMSQWYGRAGGLVGSDRVMAAGKATSATQLRIDYDKDVAQRTNMSPREGSNGTVGIAYDKDVAQRTNMQRGQPSEPIKSATVPSQPKN